MAATTSSEGGRGAPEGPNCAAICSAAIVSQICQANGQVVVVTTGAKVGRINGRLARRTNGLRVIGRSA